MPYYTGTANDWAALLAALHSACTSNGWTLAGNVLHKGTAYVHVAVDTWANVRDRLNQGIGSIGLGSTQSLYIQPGTGIDGGNNLVGGAPCIPRVGIFYQNNGGELISVPFTFPVSYEVHVHANPDEVFLVIKHDVDHYQQMSFGHNPQAEATGGTGCWASATMPPQVSNNTSVTTGGDVGFRAGSEYVGIQTSSNGTTAYPAPAPPLFRGNHQTSFAARSWTTLGMDQTGSNAARTLADTIHHGVDGAQWSGGRNFQANVSVTASPKLQRGISEVDGSAALIRPVASILRSDNKVSTVAQFEHFRLMRIDHLPVESLYELGPDTWKIYPFIRRSPDGSFPLGDGTNTVSHSGYLGWAVRYDGA